MTAGNYVLTAVPDTTTNSVAPQDSEFDIQQAYKKGATLNNAPSQSNDGVAGKFGENTKGPYFENQKNAQDKLNIEDDAVIFAFIDRGDSNSPTAKYLVDTRGSNYVVLKGSDLADLDANTVSWAFTGATVKTSNVATVDLGYVRLLADPTDSTVYGYVTADASRTYEDGHYVYVDVLTDTSGKAVQYKTDKTVIQDKTLLKKLYKYLEEGGVFQLLLDKNGYLVGIVEESTQTATIAGMTGSDPTIIKLANSDTSYFLTDDTVVINAGNPNDDLQKNDAITYIADKDGNLILVVYRIDYYVPGEATIGNGINAQECEAVVTRSGDSVTVSLTKNTGNTFSDDGDQFVLTIQYDTGKTVTKEGVRSNDKYTITFNFTPEANVTSLSLAHK